MKCSAWEAKNLRSKFRFFPLVDFSRLFFCLFFPPFPDFEVRSHGGMLLSTLEEEEDEDTLPESLGLHHRRTHPIFTNTSHACTQRVRTQEHGHER